MLWPPTRVNPPNQKAPYLTELTVEGHEASGTWHSLWGAHCLIMGGTEKNKQREHKVIEAMAEGKRGCGSPGGSAFWWGVVSEKLLRGCYKEKLSLQRKVYIPRRRGGGKSFQQDKATCAKPPKHETSLRFWRPRMECELYGEQQREKGWSSWCQSQRGSENLSEEPELSWRLKAGGAVGVWGVMG